VKEMRMNTEERGGVTRREVISKLVLGIAGGVLAFAVPRPERDAKDEEFAKNTSDRDASYYKRLAG